MVKQKIKGIKGDDRCFDFELTEWQTSEVYFPPQTNTSNLNSKTMLYSIFQAYDFL